MNKQYFLYCKINDRWGLVAEFKLLLTDDTPCIWLANDDPRHTSGISSTDHDIKPFRHFKTAQETSMDIDKPTAEEIRQSIKGMTFTDAIRVIERDFNGIREQIADEGVARFTIDGDGFSNVMFFDNREEPIAAPSFRFFNY
jgi:hypothetical protein